MAKSFKKVIASLLAVLMVCFSMPFTALATPAADYEPNMTLRFGTFSENSALDFTSTNFAQTTPDWSWYSGLNGPALDYTGSLDTKTGAFNISSLYLDTAKIGGVLEYNEMTLEDYAGQTEGTVVYEEGMAFTLSFILENVDYLNTLETKYLTYSSNIAPAYVWTSGTTAAKAKGVLGTKEDYDADTAKSKTLKTNANGVVAGQNSDDFYADGYLNSSDDSYIRDGNVFISCGDQGGNHTDDITKIDTTLYDSITDPETGITGYDCAGKAVLVTYAFIVTGEISETNPLSIGLSDITNIGSLGCAPTYDDLKDIDHVTYALQDGAAGSGNFYFMGYNANTGEYLASDEPATHQHTYTSDITQPTCGKDGYITYTCNNSDGLGTAGDDSYTEGVDKHPELAKTGNHTEGDPVVENEVKSTCTTYGTYDEVVYCTVCEAELSRTEKTKTELDPTNHDYVAGTYVDATCTVAGYTPYKCSECGAEMKEFNEADPAKGHTDGDPVTENDVASTCTTYGTYDVVVYCTVCEAEVSRETKTKTELDPNNHDWVAGTYVDATCTKAGYTPYTCSRCQATKEEVNEADPAKGHKEGTAVRENEVASTCSVLGTYDSVVYCDVCGVELSRTPMTETELAPHTPAAAVVENEKAPTNREDGSYDSVVYCAKCDAEISRDTITVPATGIIVTVDNTYENYGDVNVAYGANTYKYLDTVELTATPVDGAAFVGWEISGKRVSEDPTYTFVATSDVTVKPIFADSASAITVIFLDMYNNVAYSYAGDVAGFAAAMEAGIPAGTNYPGYTFSGWSLTDEEIKAIDKSTTISSNYTATGNTYTVTLDGTGTIDGEAVTTKEVTYDTKVTLYSEGATSWTVNGAPVAYGDTYSFYVGSDITVTPVTGTVTAKPEVAMVKAAVTDAANKKVNYLATMSVSAEDGYTLLDHGFVYVADQVAASELTVDAAGTKAPNGKTIKKITAGDTGSNQFALNYSVKTTQYATVVAYIVYKSADGSVTYDYSDAVVFDYNTIA